MAVEHNAYPDRLDLCDIHLRRAREFGGNIVINTDSHHISHLDAMHYGVKQLRRAWLTKEDVLNSRPVEDFLAGLRKGPWVDRKEKTDRLMGLRPVFIGPRKLVRTWGTAELRGEIGLHYHGNFQSGVKLKRGLSRSLS